MKYEFNGSQIVESMMAAVMRLLDRIYEDVVIGGPGGLGSAEDLGRSYLRSRRSLEGQIDALIFWHTLAAACTGFVTGVPGLMTLPLTIPADVVATLAIQLRMAAAIAWMCGYDLRDDQVKAFCYVCLCGNAASNMVKDLGVKLGTRFAEQGVERVSGEVLAKINAAVGFRLVTKFGQEGVVNLGHAIPLVGGAVGAAFDGTTTAIVGKAAKSTFYDPAEEKSRNDH